jgi:N-formylglutamate amidohydrolase
MRIIFKADGNDDIFDATRPDLTIVFATDNSCTIEQLNDIYTRFLRAVGYSVIQPGDIGEYKAEDLEF